MGSPESPKSRGIAVIGKAKTLALINADDADQAIAKTARIAKIAEIAVVGKQNL